MAEHALAIEGSEPAFDRLARLAADIAGVPTGLVTILLEHEQRFLGACGIDGTGTPRADSFCAHGLGADTPLVVPDAALDPRFAANPLVTGGPRIRFYAGVPLVLAPGLRAGMLCAIDSKPHPSGLDSTALARLQALADTAVDLIRLRVGAMRAQESERRMEHAIGELESVLEAMPAALAVFNDQGVLQRSNRLFRDTLMPPNPGSRVDAAAIEAGMIARGHQLFPLPVPPGGRGRHYEALLSDGRWLRGSIVGAGPGRAVGVASDVTELKSRERTIAAQRALLRATLDTIDLGILVIGPDLSIVLSNDRYFDMVRAPEPLRRIGVSFRDIASHWATNVARLEEAPEDYVASSLRSFARRESRRLEVPTQDGRSLVIQRVAMADGRFLITVEDVTRTREAERARDEFVATVSHELRTPLTSIAGSLGLLAGGAAGALEPRGRRMVEIAHANSQRLVRLINDILDIEKIGSGKVPVAPVAMDAPAATAAAIEALRAYADGFGATIALAPVPDDLPQMRADPDRYAQVVTNLVSNAAKFSPAGGVVEVALARAARPGMVRLSVRDHGPGIPAAFRPRLFQRFAQSDGQKSGTGLGLAIVWEIVQRHGGEISVETQEGAGTTFNVDLPAEPEAIAPAAMPGRRVLVWDADTKQAETMAATLTQSGLGAEAAGTPAALLEAAETAAPDAILLGLGDARGLGLLQALRARPALAAVPVVALCGGDARTAAALTVADCLPRPPDLSRLVRAVSVAAGGRRPRVLHLDDDADLLQVVGAALAPVADVVAATSLAEARRALAGGMDLAILDLSLPDGSGAELLPDLAAAEPRVPVLLFSAADASPELTARVEAALTKSRVSLSRLVEAVRELTEGAAP